MTGNEYQAEQVVANVIVAGNLKIRHGGILLGFQFAAQLFMFAF
jgi:hypothetical protein